MYFRLFLILFISLLSVPHLQAVDHNWVHLNDYSRKTAGYNYQNQKFTLHTEVVDYNSIGTPRRPGLDQFRAVFTKPVFKGSHFQAEVQGSRAQEGEEFGDVNSFLRQRNEIYSNDLISLSFQSQIYSGRYDTREALGVPVDIKLTEKDMVGASAMVEKGNYFEEEKSLYKYMFNVYYRRKLFTGLYSELALYCHDFKDREEETLTTINMTLNYELKPGARINFGSYSSRTSKEVVHNHVLGAILAF